VDAANWFPTGDVATIDPMGYMNITGGRVGAGRRVRVHRGLPFGAMWCFFGALRTTGSRHFRT